MNSTSIRAAVAAAALVALVATGCSASEPEVTPAPAAAATTEAPEPTTESPTPTQEPTTGSREAPLQLGETRAIQDGSAFVVGITDVNYDAAAEVHAYNEYADAPPEGWRFVRATITATLDAEALRAQSPDVESEGMDVANSVFTAYVGSDGRSYEEYSGDIFCGVGNMWWEQSAVFTYEATITGNICIPVPTDALAGGFWRISNFNNKAVWIQGAE